MTRHPAVQTLHDMVGTKRTVMVRITPAIERRLKAQAKRLLESDPEAIPEDEDWPETVRILIEANLDHGLDDSEREAGLASTLDGKIVPRPKPKLKRRLKWAWRELRGK